MCTGGLGDLVVSLGVVRALHRRGTRVELWCNFPGIARWLLRELDLWDDDVLVSEEPFPGFDFWVQLNTMATFKFERNFRAFPSTVVEAAYLNWVSFARCPEWGPLIRMHPGLDNAVGRLAVKQGMDRASLPYRMLGLDPSPRPPHVDLRAGPYDWEPFVTVHDGYDVTQTNVPVRATKTWNLRHWRDLIALFRKRFPDHMVVQLGGPTSRPIPGVDVDLTCRTPLEKSLRVLARSELHVDGDSGLVHAARLFGVRSVAMFGPTPAAFFGYAENTNLSEGPCGDCWWVRENWLDECAVQNPTPECMDAITPARVLGAMEGVLSGPF